ncbi:MAG TPA: hypothetical protein VHC20_02725 [Candidatus Paceibacterota bacterium]|nr:hypothetical protein [Candidatus Paceibacterota bacterium]
MSSGGHGGGSLLPGLDRIEHWLHTLLEKYSVEFPLWSLVVPFVACLIIFTLMDPGQMLRDFNFLIFVAPVWIPFLIGRFAWRRWVDSRVFAWNLRQPTVLLEIRLPRDTKKTPLAMETIFANIHLTPGTGTFFKKYWEGRSVPWYSFEIVSLGGRVHFYVWTRQSFRHIIETYFYSQYPGVEIVEAVDYTRVIDPNEPPYTMWGCEITKKAESPFPIKTYTDFGLDKIPVAKPEEATDPLANVIEFMGSLGPKEQLWIHIMIRYTRGYKNGKKWEDEGKELIEKIRASTVKKTTYVDAQGNKHESEGFPNPTKGQTETLAAIGRNTDKLAYDVGIRAVYVAEEGHVRDYIGAFVTQIFRPWATASQSLTPLKLWSEAFNSYPWEDRSGRIRRHRMLELLEFTRRRAYFQYPYVGPWMIMSVEELASIFHIPSSTVAAPNLPRIQSTTTEAPSNLPT